jgi:regulator of protease activity HflC (stomatin/prohibitin superfamily)
MSKEKNNNDIIEKEITKANGMPLLFFNIFQYVASVALLLGFIYCFAYGDEHASSLHTGLGIAGLIAFIALLTYAIIYSCGFHIIKPNEALVLTLFGKYYGTIKESGFYHTNPFCIAVNPTKETGLSNPSGTGASIVLQNNPNGTSSVNVAMPSKKVSTKIMTLHNEKQKVNDVLGNPIIIGAVVIWKVVDPTKAVLNVDNYMTYLSIQSDSTIRNIAKLYPYDVMDEDEAGTEESLRGSSQKIAESMQAELQEKVVDAGIEIMDVKITHLSYAEEIAAAMLQRQQATAIIAARQKIVEGAVSMVEMAIDQLNEDEVVVLDEERKAAMVSNLLVVLCGNKDAQPIVNSGSIY